MKTQIALTNLEMGAATVVMLAQLQDCKTEKQAQAHWNRVAAMLRASITALRKNPFNMRDAKLTALSKHWHQDGSFNYLTTWETPNGRADDI